MYSSFDRWAYFPQFLYVGLLWIEFSNQDVDSFYEKQVKIVHKKLTILLVNPTGE